MFDFLNRIPALVRVPTRYGFIGGILGFVLLIILYYIDRHPFLIPVFFDFRVALFAVFMYFILKELRDYYYGGILFFWQGLAACGLFLITFAFVTGLLIWIFAINVPDFVIQYVELATNQIKTFPKENIEQIGRDVYERNLALLPTTSAFDLAALYFVQCFGIGLFISIILSVLLRRQPKNQ
ncbi:MAG TPA: DUF4199 domain-containing protein [Cyclobacteriaceae bacterium]|nr:DUF4199 domain-containing protein [Cyclobacteriaceae bacterium]